MIARPDWRFHCLPEQTFSPNVEQAASLLFFRHRNQRERQAGSLPYAISRRSADPVVVQAASLPFSRSAADGQASCLPHGKRASVGSSLATSHSLARYNEGMSQGTEREPRKRIKQVAVICYAIFVLTVCISPLLRISGLPITGLWDVLLRFFLPTTILLFIIAYVPDLGRRMAIATVCGAVVGFLGGFVCMMLFNPLRERAGYTTFAVLASVFVFVPPSSAAAALVTALVTKRWTANTLKTMFGWLVASLIVSAVALVVIDSLRFSF
jgi:hypothetical protein